MPSRVDRKGRALSTALLLLSVTGCAPRAYVGEAHGASSSTTMFDYVESDGSHFSTETSLGRVTVVVLGTTYDIGTQLVIRELADLFSRHVPRFNAGMVVLEPPKSAPLAEEFETTLELPFPVVMADFPTLEGRGPFGDVTTVPTSIFLNARGEETFRRSGAIDKAAIERAITSAER